ncbi:BgTH12-02736 [Blumeria graminis f. sp. triticale]|uniref:Uncharacterized protein n=4 Tax=Blumeria graminis TaxID=34373 RepID=A0A656KLW1_BLUGR|nr:hypothetical protein BGT96224_5421 [Blumeria graminis f. sp. tritici 96224]CAD6503065.1 BgTH12-02736 [Blumeria graminis f. sp. triticale]VDB89003.1 Bgt-5421 [Blumeria graminis f. sp. tritici]
MGPCTDVVLSVGSSSLAFCWTGVRRDDATVFSNHSAWNAAKLKR